MCTPTALVVGSLVWPLQLGLHRLILPDKRGAGRTISRTDQFSLDDMAGDCLDLLDELQVQTAYIVGHSMGGMIARRLAQCHPERVGRLVIMAATSEPLPKIQILMEDTAVLYSFGAPPETWLTPLFQWLFRPGFCDTPEDVTAEARMPFISPIASRRKTGRLEVPVFAALEAGAVF